jgi:hypothetical protein
MTGSVVDAPAVSFHTTARRAVIVVPVTEKSLASRRIWSVAVS